MIRTHREYEEVKRRLHEERERLDAQRSQLAKMGLEGEQLERAMAPMISFHLQLQEEVDSYEGLLRGEIRELVNLHGLGQILVGLRISQGMTQRQLAEVLGVDESQVSRDERNEYHGISVERASRILDALSAELRCIMKTDDSGARVPSPPKEPPRVNFGSYSHIDPDQVGKLVSTWRAQKGAMR